MKVVGECSDFLDCDAEFSDFVSVSSSFLRCSWQSRLEHILPTLRECGWVLI